MGCVQCSWQEILSNDEFWVLAPPMLSTWRKLWMGLTWSPQNSIEIQWAWFPRDIGRRGLLPLKWENGWGRPKSKFPPWWHSWDTPTKRWAAYTTKRIVTIGRGITWHDPKVSRAVATFTGGFPSRWQPWTKCECPPWRCLMGTHLSIADSTATPHWKIQEKWNWWLTEVSLVWCRLVKK